MEINFFYDINDGCHSSHLEDLQLLAHLEPLLQVSFCRGLLTMVHLSSICPPITFLIFDISMVEATAAILKVFNCYLLLNHKMDGAKTWWNLEI